MDAHPDAHPPHWAPQPSQPGTSPEPYDAALMLRRVSIQQQAASTSSPAQASGTMHRQDSGTGAGSPGGGNNGGTGNGSRRMKASEYRAALRAGTLTNSSVCVFRCSCFCQEELRFPLCRVTLYIFFPFVIFGATSCCSAAAIVTAYGVTRRRGPTAA